MGTVRTHVRSARYAGKDVLHRWNHYLNKQLEQDHRGIKQRYYPMRGFGSFLSASRFCRAFEDVRQFFRIRATMKQRTSLRQQRELFLQRLVALRALVQAISQTEVWARRASTHVFVSCVPNSDTSQMRLRCSLSSSSCFCNTAF